MGKKKPKKVFRLLNTFDESIYVIARHAKGARTIALYGGFKVSLAKSAVAEVDACFAEQAVNAKEQSI